MLQKAHLFTAGFLALAASTCQAGFYVGAGLGPDTVDYKQKAHVVQSNPAHPTEGFNVHDDTHLSGTGVFGTLFAGYGYHHGQGYLAAEVNGNISSTKFNSSNIDSIHGTKSSTTYKIDNAYGVSLLPGYQFSPATLFYGRLGYVNGHVKVNTSDESLQNISKRENGFRWGLGGKQSINERLDVRMEFSQTNYSRAKMATLTSVSKNTTISPLQQLVEFALVYNFDAPAQYK